MSLPVIVDPDSVLGLKTGTLVNARWQFGLSSPAMLVFSVKSTGNSVPLVSVEIDWGDGHMDNSDFRPVGRLFRHMHAYESPGTYNIGIRAVNSDQERSVLNVVAIRVLEDRGTVVTPSNRWIGLALPSASIQAALESVQSRAPSEVVSVAADTVVGTRSIVVDSREEAFEPGALVSITQPGKLITVARVTSRALNIVQLDAEVNDVYTAYTARVEVSRTTSITQLAQKDNTDYPWYFPKTVDIELIRSAVRMILATKPCERVMLPSFGSELHAIPFEQNDALVESLVRRATLEALQKWEPRVQVEDFSIKREDNDVQVKMTLSLTRGNGSFDLVFSLEGQ